MINNNNCTISPYYDERFSSPDRGSTVPLAPHDPNLIGLFLSGSAEGAGVEEGRGCTRRVICGQRGHRASVKFQRQIPRLARLHASQAELGQTNFWPGPGHQAQGAVWRRGGYRRRLVPRATCERSIAERSESIRLDTRVYAGAFSVPCSDALCTHPGCNLASGRKALARKFMRPCAICNSRNSLFGSFRLRQRSCCSQ